MSLEIVRWRDAWFDRDGEATDQDFILSTVGWVTHEEKFLKIASEQGPDKFERAITRVPHEIVLERIPLVPQKPLL